jgi:hypothetical protein
MTAVPKAHLRRWQIAQQQSAEIRAHYLSLPGKTIEGWVEILRDPRKFNRVWRHMLGQPLSDEPPEGI